MAEGEWVEMEEWSLHIRRRRGRREESGTEKRQREIECNQRREMNTVEVREGYVEVTSE